jgi:subtilisin-like proprotein convertase family protein
MSDRIELKRLFRNGIVVAGLAVVAGMLAGAPANAATATFTNAAPIDVPSPGQVTSVIDVQGQTGRVSDVSVTLRGITHSFPREFDILLVSPDGEASILMSDACDTGTFTAASMTFSRLAAETVPGLGNCGIFHRPADYGGGDEWPNTFPGPHAANLDRVVGGNPNGLWRLFVIDDVNNAQEGKLASGWSLSIDTVEPDALVPGAGSLGFASPHPMARTVNGRGGVISDVNVGIAGVVHSKPEDLDVLLVGPRGQQVMLMSDACGNNRLTMANIGWDDEGPTGMPESGPCNGIFKPSDFEVGGMLPGAPAGPYDPTLAAFDGTEPDGEWRLYVYDDQESGDGFFTHRFELNVTRRAEALVGFAQDSIEVTEGETGVVTLTRAAGGQPLGPGTIEVTSSPQTAASGSDFGPVATTVAFARGETIKTVPIRALTDGALEAPETLELTIGEGTDDAAPGVAATARVTVRDATAASSPPPPSPSTNVDALAPTISGLALTNRRFRVGRTGTALAARRAPVGTTFRYTLSEEATVAIVIERASKARGRSRTRWVRAGRALTRAGNAGRNTVRFSGRIGRRKLRPGTYRARFLAADAAGNRSRTAGVRFRVTPTIPT